MNEFLLPFVAFFDRSTRALALDLIDIGIVAIMVYHVLVILRGTRAMQMTLSLGAVFVAHQVARVLGLATLYTVLDNLVTYVVLIIVIVFQNDIRRALLRVGPTMFFRGVRGSHEHRMIEEVVRAAEDLAQRRIGALIVFERDALLDSYIEEGVVIDARVSHELLHSIFVPSFENPMHDGAVIIREGRVFKAAAFLPLSASPRLERSLGTRHRAAIGLTEETDAVVIVVSEERASLALAFDGNLARNLSATAMRDALLGLLLATPPPRTAVESDAPTETPPTAERESVTTTIRDVPAPASEGTRGSEPDVTGS